METITFMYIPSVSQMFAFVFIDNKQLRLELIFVHNYFEHFGVFGPVVECVRNFSVPICHFQKMGNESFKIRMFLANFIIHPQRHSLGTELHFRSLIRSNRVRAPLLIK